jgi:hypothetical protein
MVRYMKKKGQLAVETLLIYGIAILVVMLAIGALIGFGVLDMGNLLPDSCQLADLTCENYAVSKDIGAGVGEVQLELRNNLGKNIDAISVKIEGEGDNKGLWQGCSIIYTDFTAQGELTKPIKIPCTIAVNPGKKITGVIYTTVNLTGSSISRTIKGSIRATVS